MNKELAEAVKLFISQPLNNPLSRGQMMEIARIALPILEQQERGEGEWIEWGGGDQPLDDYEMVEVRFRNGSIEAGEFAHCYEWNHGYHDLSTTSVDIIAYRIIPERATTQNGEQ